MTYIELFEKQVINEQFNSNQLLKVLLNNEIYPVNNELVKIKKKR